MPAFLTVKEAAALTGKSPSSIRRIFYPILENPRHPDRHHIEPDEKQAKALRLKGDTFAWKISEELLQREVQSKSRNQSGPVKPTPVNGDRGSAAVIEMLQRELGIKNKQIDTQNELLKELSQRLREGNILMGSLQQQLALTDGSHRQQKPVHTQTEAASPGEGSQSTTKSKGRFAWLHKKIF